MVRKTSSYRYPNGDIIKFDALENPKWRTTSNDNEQVMNGVKVEDMIQDIMDCHHTWDEKKTSYNQQIVDKVQDDLFLEFVAHVNREEGHGFSTVEETRDVLRKDRNQFLKNGMKRSISIEGRETKNIEGAYKYLMETIKEENKAEYGLLELGLLQETHKEILKGLPLASKGCTKPGQLSSKRRITTYNGESYEYQNPPDMEAAAITLIDRYNLLFDTHTKGGLKSFDDYYSLFKICAWFTFEFLDLHPFGDGNGRLCRIVCSYILSYFTPFPTPIYNVWTTSSKDDYKTALVEARKSEKRHPCALTTMIIECCWKGWKKFLTELDSAQDGCSS